MQKLSLKLRHFRTSRTPTAVQFPFPVHEQIRLAALNDCIPVFGLLKPFYPESATHLEGFRPNILAGTALELQQLVEPLDLGTVNLSCIDHAVIALTRCGQPPINDVARVVLWQAFGVPVYEVFAGLDNSILGYECELHEGWHLAPSVRFSDQNGELMLHAEGVTGVHTALAGFMTEDECPCGRCGPRLLQAEPVKRMDQWQQPWAATA